MSAPPAALDGAQAQAMQVRLARVQGRASLDGAPLHPLRPPAERWVVSPLSHAREKCTHTVPLCVRSACKQTTRDIRSLYVFRVH